jgi:CRP/FNR family transcriptional regulator, cyclic AMP receptor protein
MTQELLQPAETVQIFQKQPDAKLFAPGEVIFEIGQPGDVMYGILEGEVELWVSGKVVETLQAGDVFGEGALVHEDGTRASTAIAKTNCKLAYLDQKRFIFVVQETPQFALKVLRSYSNRLRRIKASV